MDGVGVQMLKILIQMHAYYLHLFLLTGEVGIVTKA